MHKNILLYKAMLQHFAGDPRRCQHFIKVASLAKEIAILEGADQALIDLVEAAGFIHDCGIVVGEAKYGKGHCTGKIQEEEGPAVAQRILSELGYETENIDRICYLVGHHHTYSNIDGLDYQILVEADFLVNFYEDGLSEEAIAHTVAKIFRTVSGKALAKSMFGM